MAQDFYGNTHDHTHRDDRNHVDAELDGYMTHGIPMNRNNVLFYPAAGLAVPDRTVGFREWSEQERESFQSS
jgi:hypothetical protein